jgi:hypothetical protein
MGAVHGEAEDVTQETMPNNDAEEGPGGKHG